MRNTNRDINKYVFFKKYVYFAYVIKRRTYFERLVICNKGNNSKAGKQLHSSNVLSFYTPCDKKQRSIKQFYCI